MLSLLFAFTKFKLILEGLRIKAKVSILIDDLELEIRVINKIETL